MSERQLIEVETDDLKGIVESLLSACGQKDIIGVAKSICELGDLPEPVWSNEYADWVPGWDRDVA